MIGFRSGTVPSRFDAPGSGDPLGALVDQIDHVLGRQRAGGGVERGEHVLGAGGLAGVAPRRDVGVVVEPGADDPVAGAQRGADGPADRERERGHVRAEADAGGIGAEQTADHRPCPADELAGGLRRLEPAAAAGGGGAAHPRRGGLDGDVDHLGAGGGVEPGPAVGDAGETVADRGVRHARTAGAVGAGEGAGENGRDAGGRGQRALAAALASRLAVRPIGSIWRPSRSPTSTPLSNSTR